MEIRGFDLHISVDTYLEAIYYVPIEERDCGLTLQSNLHGGPRVPSPARAPKVRDIDVERHEVWCFKQRRTRTRTRTRTSMEFGSELVRGSFPNNKPSPARRLLLSASEQRSRCGSPGVFRAQHSDRACLHRHLPFAENGILSSLILHDPLIV